MKNNWRQKLHLEPLSGWLNDPNGLCFFGGYYHVYFQYAPESPYGDDGKCWGHWQSPDLLKWTFTGAVLRPDIPEDRDGVYSGCGFPDGDVLRLFYTGNVKEEGDYDYINSGRGANVITVTTENGHDMSAKKVLLRNEDYPEYCSCHVRDPKVWKESDEKYLMVLGARTRLDEGCVIVYKSSDLESWEFDSLYGIPDFGYMWECPDYFTVGGKAFLSISPQGLPHEKYKFQNVYSSGYFKAGKEPKDYNEWDCGFDFYAPQTFVAPDGRRLLIGWMGIGDIPYTNPTTELGWQHCLTVPRELTLAADGSLRQAPVRELEKLRHEGETLTNGMTAQLPFEMCAETSSRFTLDMGGYLVLSYADGVFTMRFNDEKTGGGRGERNVLLFACTDIRILADTSSLEIYLSGGEKVLSSRFYPDDTSVKLTFNGISGTLYELDGMEVSYDGK